MASDLPVSPGDVAAAAERLRGSVAATPSLRSAQLSRVTGATVVVKCENLQFTGSFKERGARNRLSTLTDAERGAGSSRSRQETTLAVAHHAGVLGIDCTVVMPATTPWAKVAPIEGFGAAGRALRRDVRRRTGARRRARTGIGCSADPAVRRRRRDRRSGHGRARAARRGARPRRARRPRRWRRAARGIAVAAKDRRPDLHIVGVQSELFPSLVREPTPQVPVGAPTIAEGIAVKQPGALTRADHRGAGRRHACRRRVAHRGGDQPLPRDGEARGRGRGRGRARRAARVSRALP